MDDQRFFMPAILAQPKIDVNRCVDEECIVKFVRQDSFFVSKGQEILVGYAGDSPTGHYLHRM